MSEKIIQLNEEVIKGQIKELVREGVEETLNGTGGRGAEAGPKRHAMSAARNVRSTGAAITNAI